MSVLSNALLSTLHVERTIVFGLGLGVTFSVVASKVAPAARRRGGRAARVAVELQRKSFHMIGGCLIAATFHHGLRTGFLSPAFADPQGPPEALGAFMSAHAALLACSFAAWSLEAARLTFPAVNEWYKSSFKGVVREKEFQKASGVAFFLPGCLAAALAGPSNIAVLGMLFLSVGDAASSLGTAAGVIPVGASPRKVEGSLACWLVCTALGHYMGLELALAVVAAGVVTVGEVLAEVIGLDDNLVLPMLGVLGVRLAVRPEFAAIGLAMGVVLGVGILLGVAVARATPAETNSTGNNKKTSH